MNIIIYAKWQKCPDVHSQWIQQMSSSRASRAPTHLCTFRSKVLVQQEQPGDQGWKDSTRTSVNSAFSLILCRDYACLPSLLPWMYSKRVEAALWYSMLSPCCQHQHPISNPWESRCESYLLCFQSSFLAICLENNMDDPSTYPLTLMCETQMGILAPGFSMAHTQLLWTRGAHTSKWKTTILCFSLSHWIKSKQI